MKRTRFAIIVGMLLSLAVRAGFAASPWFIDPAGSGKPFTWGGGYLPWYIEQGGLGPLSAEEVSKIVNEAFAMWKNARLVLPGLIPVPTANLSPTAVGIIKQEIGPANWTQYYLTKVVIVLDPDGAILASRGIPITDVAAVTFLAKETQDVSGLTLKSGVTILNGKFLEGADVEDPVYMGLFKATVMHELGHLLNLDHSAVNQDVEGDLAIDTGLAGAIPTMYPMIVTPEQQSLHDDDLVAVSQLYPRPELTGTFCTIAGKLIGSDQKGFQGALVIARSKLDPFTEAISAVTGNNFPQGTSDGSYFVRGIRPGRKYTVEYSEINPMFIGPSSIQPYGDEDGEKPRAGFGSGMITGGGGKLKEVSCEKGGQTIAMDTVQLSVAAGGESPKNSQVPQPPEPSAAAEEKSGGCSLIRSAGAHVAPSTGKAGGASPSPPHVRLGEERTTPPGVGESTG